MKQRCQDLHPSFVICETSVASSKEPVISAKVAFKSLKGNLGNRYHNPLSEVFSTAKPVGTDDDHLLCDLQNE
jgi:hypothetical protein